MSDLVQVAEKLRGLLTFVQLIQPCFATFVFVEVQDSSNVEEQTFVAENELLNAANAIEEAAKKISTLRPRENNKVSGPCGRRHDRWKNHIKFEFHKADKENLNFDEQILDAARSITNAAGALIKAATLAQKEITVHGKVFK